MTLAATARRHIRNMGFRSRSIRFPGRKLAEKRVGKAANALNEMPAIAALCHVMRKSCNNNAAEACHGTIVASRDLVR